MKYTLVLLVAALSFGSCTKKYTTTNYITKTDTVRTTSYFDSISHPGDSSISFESNKIVLYKLSNDSEIVVFNIDTFGAIPGTKVQLFSYVDSGTRFIINTGNYFLDNGVSSLVATQRGMYSFTFTYLTTRYSFVDVAINYRGY